MTIYEYAEALKWREMGNELTEEEEKKAKELGFVVVFAYSDDNAEFRGAIDDEVGCFDGGRIYENGDKYIDALWCVDVDNFTWTYETNIEHAIFPIYEDGEGFCKGIVMRLEDMR